MAEGSQATGISWDDYPVSAGYIQCVDCGACQGDSTRARGQMYLIASVQILICSDNIAKKHTRCAPSSYKYGYNSTDRRYNPSYPIIMYFIVGAHNSIYNDRRESPCKEAQSLPTCNKVLKWSGLQKITPKSLNMSLIFQRTTGCTRNRVPMVFIVFSRDFCGL